jgi:hypothetical protein
MMDACEGNLTETAIEGFDYACKSKEGTEEFQRRRSCRVPTPSFSRLCDCPCSRKGVLVEGFYAAVYHRGEHGLVRQGCSSSNAILPCAPHRLPQRGHVLLKGHYSKQPPPESPRISVHPKGENATIRHMVQTANLHHGLLV